MSETTVSSVYSGAAGTDEKAPQISARRIAQLAWKTWPFMRPMLKHFIVFTVLGLVAGTLGSYLYFMGTDLFSNKVLMGRKLQPHQAWVLGLDESYVADERVDAANGKKAGPAKNPKTGADKSVKSAQLKDFDEAQVREAARKKGLSDEDIDKYIDGVKHKAGKTKQWAGKTGKSAPWKGKAGKASRWKGKSGKSKGSTWTEEQVDPSQLLTQGQRKTVRNRMLLYGIIFAVFGFILGMPLPYYVQWVWHNVNQNLRVAMIDRAQQLSLKYHNHAKVGDVVYRVYQDSAMVMNVINGAIIGPAYAIWGILVGLAFICFFDPLLALLAVLVAVPVVWLAVKWTPRLRRRSMTNRMANSQLTSRLQEVFSAIKVVKANRAETQVFEQFNRDSHRALDAAFNIRLEMLILSLLVGTITGAALIGGDLLMVKWLHAERETYLGALVAGIIGFTVWNWGAYQIAKGRFGGAIYSSSGMVGLWSMMQDLFIGLERAFYLLDLEPDVVDPDDPRDFPVPIQEVIWSDVQFAYESGQPVLKGVDLEARTGTITAIVGSTGSGKSTLMSMLLRLYDPERGSVRINGVDLRDMRIDDVRSNTAIVLQKNVLFSATVANNISYGITDVSREKVADAARIACADGFVSQMARGYDTELGERGGKLSSGERQRLSIARAVVRDTPILVLDEPTASLDAETEREVLKNLSEWGPEKIIFLITHRLSTIRKADQIAFLEDGRIAELGSHETLMAREDGRYREFVEAETVGNGEKGDTP